MHGHCVVPVSAVRFFPLLLPVFFGFFFVRTTLMGGGVPVRGMSSSTSYAGNADGSGAEAGPFPMDVGRDSGLCKETGGDGRGAAPVGISPTLSTTKDNGVETLGVLRRLGRRELIAKSHISIGPPPSCHRIARERCLLELGSGGRSSNLTTGIESKSSCCTFGCADRLSTR